MKNTIESNFIYANSEAGDMVLSNNSSYNMLNNPKHIFENIISILKDRKKRIIIIVLSLIWFLLIIFKSFGINFFILDCLNYLSFANGGTGGNIIAIIGGFIGKTIFAYFITTLLLFKNNISWIKSGINNFIKAVDFKKQYLMICIGIGVSLIVYNFISGDASINNSIIGIVSILLLLKTLSSKTGIMRKVLYLFSNKVGIIKGFDSDKLNSVIIGIILGFVLGIIISLIGTNLCYVIGLIVLIAGVVVNFAIKKI